MGLREWMGQAESKGEYRVAFVTAWNVSPVVPAVERRVSGANQYDGMIYGGRTPDCASGIWPEPVWRVGDLKSAHRCADQGHVNFAAGKITALEPSWRWFGPQGQQIERVAQATLSLSPDALRAADRLPRPPAAWLQHPDRPDTLHNLSECVQSGIWRELKEKAKREDPSAGEDVFLHLACIYIWELANPGWVTAELITNVAMRALLLGDRLTPDERERRLRPWRDLVGADAARDAGM